MENFQSLGLPEALLNRLESIEYVTPTPIQAQTIPHALQGLDVLGTAQTGTGKTAAYVIPLIYHLLNSVDTTALVLTPTREIAIQVANFVGKILERKSNLKTALIIGGDSMSNQLNQLRMKPRIIIGTPGRINDHLERKSLKLERTTFVVLDETDRMLDMGFSIQLDQIFKFLPAHRQTLMFSATLPQNIQKIAAQYLKEPVRISVGSTVAAADTITQEVIHTSEAEKYEILLQQLDLREGSVIIFVKTKFSTEKLAQRLRDHGHSVDAIHGDLRQRNREKVMRYFRSKKNRILVATDIAARGLDIAHVECVINHDLPQCEEDFIHRIGRTGRAGMEGVAVSLITPQDNLKWRNINKMMNPNAKLDLVDDVKPSSRKRSRGNVDRFKRNASDKFSNKPRRDSEESYSAHKSASSMSRSSNGANRFGRNENRSENGANRFGRSENRSENGANRFGRNENRSESGPNRFGRSENRSENGANRFGRNENRSENGANRFGRNENRSESGANRFGRNENRSESGANRFGRSENRSENGANRFGRNENRSESGANRFGRSENRSESGANRFGKNENRSENGANRFGRSENKSESGANRFGKNENRSGGNANKFGRSANKPGMNKSNTKRPRFAS